MRTRIYLVSGSERLRVTEHGAYGVVEGVCPKCGAAPLKVQGTGRRPSADDRAWEADAVAVCCGAYVGTLRAEVNTLFGVREDRAVLEGRCRVY